MNVYINWSTYPSFEDKETKRIGEKGAFHISESIIL